MSQRTASRSCNYLAWTERKWAPYQAALKRLAVTVDGVERQATRWPDWAITTRLDTAHVADTVWKAVCCHETQMSIYEKLADLSAEHHRLLWGTQEYYRAMSLVNGGRAPETDLFEGLRRGTRTTSTRSETGPRRSRSHPTRFVTSDVDWSTGWPTGWRRSPMAR